MLQKIGNLALNKEGARFRINRTKEGVELYCTEGDEHYITISHDKVIRLVNCITGAETAPKNLIKIYDLYTQESED